MYNLSNFGTVDHIAIAVLDLDEAIRYHTDVLGFRLDSIRDTAGKNSGMRSAVLFSEQFSVVLLVSTSEGSQIEKYINKYGPGVQHIAFACEDIETVRSDLIDKGMQFATDVLKADGLKQSFTKRDENTGMMYELIERSGNFNFEDQNVNNLFEQLESNDLY
ncbi:VOC family protein [Pseudoalteromonas umbrosa]|uniref:VOC family protein n=1 Tax=Pseudoalteromonas umbrosa TaxID=3048489 RepID=UPI0024C2EAF8|nr:VOC family protein [Pseudoalteromonas sp. B95]MDK1287005.1 VOC family protein [Pseudoalteromonas sp. B95]